MGIDPSLMYISGPYLLASISRDRCGCGPRRNMLPTTGQLKGPGGSGSLLPRLPLSEKIEVQRITVATTKENPRVVQSPDVVPSAKKHEGRTDVQRWMRSKAAINSVTLLPAFTSVIGLSYM